MAHGWATNLPESNERHDDNANNADRGSDNRV